MFLFVKVELALPYLTTEGEMKRKLFRPCLNLYYVVYVGNKHYCHTYVVVCWLASQNR